MDKVICIKEFLGYFTEGKSYRCEKHLENDLNEFQLHKVYVSDNRVVPAIAFEYSLYKEHFISLCEWREQQINSILE